MFRNAIILLISWLAMAAGAQAQAVCAVTFRVLDVTGQSVPHIVTEFRGASGQDYSSTFSDLRGNVPCSLNSYRFQVKRSDSNNIRAFISGTVFASRPETWISVTTPANIVFDGDRAISVSEVLPVGYVLRGTVTPVPTERIWLQIRSVASAVLVEAEVDADGTFRIYSGFSRGTYIATLLTESGELHAVVPLAIKEFAPTEQLHIALPGRVDVHVLK